MYNSQSTVARPSESVLTTNKLVKNTYILLSMTVLFSGVVGYFVMQAGLPYPGFVVYLVGVIGLFMLTRWLRNSAMGILAVFALTGFLGYIAGTALAPLLQVANGADVILYAFGGTGVIFLGLSAYALTTRKNFNFLGGFLFAGILILLVATVANFFLELTAMSLAISSVAILIFSGYILYDTSRMVHGHETNYITATVNLYINIWMLFMNLVNLLMALSGND